jgi:hypothetical protein
MRIVYKLRDRCGGTGGPHPAYYADQEGDMQQIITAQQDGRAVSFQRGSPDAALEKALQLQKEGFKEMLIEGLDEISITDSTGRTYGPGDFAAYFVHTRA